jgi:hypothetical protein
MKPTGPEVQKLNRKLLRTEGAIRDDLRQQLTDMNDRWESWKRKTDAGDI